MTSAVIELDADFPAQDYILINAKKSPGQAIIKPPNSPRGWDERQGYALSGASLVPSGNPLGTFSIVFRFWDPAVMPAWYEYAATYFDESVRFNPGTITPRALGIYHPILAAPPIRITQVVVTDAIGLDKTEDGLWFAEVYFKRYRAPVKVPPAPKAAIPAAATAAPVATDAAQVEINNLSAQRQQLAGS